MGFLDLIKGVFAKKRSTPHWKDSWTDVLETELLINIDIFDKANDIKELRPDWYELGDTDKVKILVQLFKNIAYYESSYDESVSVKGLSKSLDKNSYACGLFQFSVYDQAYFKTSTSYSYNDLLIGENNIRGAIGIMIRQINLHKKIFIPKGEDGVFWAVIHPNGKFDKSDVIKSFTRNFQLDKKDKPSKVVDEIPWMAIAENELGQMETVKENPRIIEYHSATSLKAQSQKIAWCASFVCWVLKKAGYKSTGTSWARDFLDYGIKLEQPKKGCIMVFERNGAGGDSHVAFWTGDQTRDFYLVISGNQSDAVCRKLYAKKDLLGMRWPLKK